MASLSENNVKYLYDLDMQMKNVEKCLDTLHKLSTMQDWTSMWEYKNAVKTTCRKDLWKYSETSLYDALMLPLEVQTVGLGP